MIKTILRCVEGRETTEKGVISSALGGLEKTSQSFKESGRLSRMWGVGGHWSILTGTGQAGGGKWKVVEL